MHTGISITSYIYHVTQYKNSVWKKEKKFFGDWVDRVFSTVSNFASEFPVAHLLQGKWLDIIHAYDMYSYFAMIDAVCDLATPCYSREKIFPRSIFSGLRSVIVGLDFVYNLILYAVICICNVVRPSQNVLRLVESRLFGPLYVTPAQVQAVAWRWI